MAHTTTLHAPIGAVALSHARGFLARLIAGYRAWKARRDTYRELSRLSPEILDDIGVSRADLDREFLGL